MTRGLRMKIIDCLDIARYDIRQKNKIYLRMIHGMLLIISVLLFSEIAMSAINRFYKDTVLDYSRKNCALYFPQRDLRTGRYSARDEEVISILSDLLYVESTIDDVVLDVPRIVKEDQKSFINMNEVSLVHKSNIYKSTENNNNDVIKLNVIGYASDYQMLSRAEAEAFVYQNPTEQLMLLGRMPQTDCEFLLDNMFLEELNISLDEAERLLDEKITICVNECELFSDMVLVGIINSNFTNETHLKTAQLWISLDEEEMAVLPKKSERVVFYLDSWEDGKAITEEIDRLQLSDTVFYDEEESRICGYVSNLQVFADFVIKMIAFFIVVALGMSLFNLYRGHICDSAQYYGMLSAIGMQSKDIYRIYFCEILFIFLIGIIETLPITVILLNVANLILSFTLGGGLDIELKSIVFSFIKVTSLTALFSFVMTGMILNKQFSKPLAMQLRKRDL